MDPRSILNSKRKIDPSVREVLTSLVNEVERLDSINHYLLSELQKVREPQVTIKPIDEKVPEPQETINEPQVVIEEKVSEPQVTIDHQETSDDTNEPQVTDEEEKVPETSEEPQVTSPPPEEPKKVSRFGRKS
jgi:hypothetical protein